ncbi:LuxR C-terminal-related transcriptional regulator [Azospirillum largimobile]
MDDLMPRVASPATLRLPAPQDREALRFADIVLVGGDRLALRGISCLLEQTRCVAGTEMYDSIDAALHGSKADLIIMHTSTPNPTGARVKELLQHRQAVAFLAAGVQGSDGAAALRMAGAHGLLDGTETPELCAGMIRLALAGGCCWPAALPPERNFDNWWNSTPGARVRLTARQREIVEELVRGSSNKRIAHAIGISEGTVKIHVTAILRALDVNNRSAAVARLLLSRTEAHCAGTRPATAANGRLGSPEPTSITRPDRRKGDENALR